MEVEGVKKYSSAVNPVEKGLFYEGGDKNLKCQVTIDFTNKQFKLTHRYHFYNEVSHGESISGDYTADLEGTISKGEGSALIAEVKGNYRIHRQEFGQFDNFHYDLSGNIVIEQD